MKTFIADIIPSLQRFSLKLDDTTKLMNQHWVCLSSMAQAKCVYIFRSNNQLLISENGHVVKGTWEYLGNQSLLLESRQESYLLKHGFFDENVLALKLDSTERFVFFVNETRYDKELNTVDDVLLFLSKKYIKSEPEKRQTLSGGIEYIIVREYSEFAIAWGNYIVFKIRFFNGLEESVYKGLSTGKYFYFDISFGKKYYDTFDEAVYHLFLHLTKSYG